MDETIVDRVPSGEDDLTTALQRIKWPSPIYPWVRARQLEGTWPGDKKTGACVSTVMRVQKGWGSITEDIWPDDGKAWPIIEPPGLDLKAKACRIGAYQRVNTVEECREVISNHGLVQASFAIDDTWKNAPNGVIPPPGNRPITVNHSIVLIGMSTRKRRFVFLNTWGPGWGRRGWGFLPYSYFPSRFIEGWMVTVPESESWEPSVFPRIKLFQWYTQSPFGDLYCSEIVDTLRDEILAWGIAIEREDSLDLEELFVRPGWRRQGCGSLLATEFAQLAADLDKRLRAWVPHPDGVKGNEEALNKILLRMGLVRRPSPVRWAAAVGESP